MESFKISRILLKYFFLFPFPFTLFPSPTLHSRQIALTSSRNSNLAAFADMRVGISSQDREGRDTTGSNVLIQPGNHSFGKILKRLELLEKAFNSYVGSHRQRLEARLEENKDFVNSFEQEMRLVKEEIYNLATQSNKEQNESE